MRKYFAFILLAAGSPYAYAEGIVIPQVTPDSVLIDRQADAALTPATPARARPIGDDLKDILQDHKMSELGRANSAISSQYGAQPLVEGSTTPAKNTAPVIK